MAKCSSKKLKQNFRDREHSFRLRKEKSERNDE